MPVGYKLDPYMQMKIEDERAGRLDYVYETSLSVDECRSRIGSEVNGKLSRYESELKDGIQYILFPDDAKDTGGLFVSPPQKYAVMFECAPEKTVIRVRYIWENELSVQYLMREDIDAFFTSLFSATVSESEKKVWIDSAEKYAEGDPLKLHGSKAFWVVAAVFVILWVAMMFWMS